MKILFYGGCHASALRRIAERFSTGKHTFDHLTNFSMIKRGEPFPYEHAAGFDLIIFSPIVNQGDWNTSFLEEFCIEKKIPFVKFPWLQWNGYFPGVTKMRLGWHTEWWNSALLAEAKKYEDFDTFYESIIDGSFLSDQADANLATTTRLLRMKEQASNVHIPISDFIERNFRHERLFLTPDHAATGLYKYIYSELQKLVGPVVDKSFFYTDIEIQEGMKTPILPSIVRHFDLRFGGGDYCNRDFSGNSLIVFRDYLRIQHSARDVVLVQANYTTRAKGRIEDRSTFTSCLKGDSFIAMDLTERKENHFKINLLAPARTLRSSSAKLSGSTQWLYKPHWSVTRFWAEDHQ